MNIVLIVADTVRRDYLPCYGNDIVHAPHLTALAGRSAVLDRYYAAGFPTMPTRADHFLGKWTFTYLSWEPLPQHETPLARILSNAGYTTIGVVDTPFYKDNGFGYDRGFKYFYELRTQNPHRLLIPEPRATEYDYCAPKTFVTAEQALERVYRDRFFLLVDTWDPHEPWDPPAHYVERYLPNWDGRVVNPPYDYAQNHGLTEADLEVARACYMGEITMVDRWVGRLLERLESLGIAQQTAVLFTTDHGFYFGDHGGLFGKMGRIQQRASTRGVWVRSPLYEPVAHIPLIAHIPGAPAMRVRHLLSAIDLMPTILDLAGVQVPEGLTLHGRSFAHILHGEATAPGLGTEGRDMVVSAVPLANPGESIRVVDSWLRRVQQYQPATITTSDGWCLIYAAQGEPVELYYLPDDPGQVHNLAADRPDIVAELHRRYVSLLADVGTRSALLEPRSRL